MKSLEHWSDQITFKSLVVSSMLLQSWSIFLTNLRINVKPLHWLIIMQFKRTKTPQYFESDYIECNQKTKEGYVNMNKTQHIY